MRGHSNRGAKASSMKRNWKPLLIVALIAAAVYYLLPSVKFYGMSDEERAAMDLNAPEQLVDLHKRSLNLGLDLQGGIHLVLEVKIDGLEAEAAADAGAASGHHDRHNATRPAKRGYGEMKLDLHGPFTPLLRVAPFSRERCSVAGKSRGTSFGDYARCVGGQRPGEAGPGGHGFAGPGDAYGHDTRLGLGSQPRRAVEQFTDGLTLMAFPLREDQ